VVNALDAAQVLRVAALIAALDAAGEDRPMGDVVEAAHYILTGQQMPIDDRFIHRHEVMGDGRVVR
jgi:hypothetical protein